MRVRQCLRISTFLYFFDIYCYEWWVATKPSLPFCNATCPWFWAVSSPRNFRYPLLHHKDSLLRKGTRARQNFQEGGTCVLVLSWFCSSHRKSDGKSMENVWKAAITTSATSFGSVHFCPTLRHPATSCDALRPEAAPSCFSWSGPPRRARAATLGAQCWDFSGASMVPRCKAHRQATAMSVLAWAARAPGSKGVLRLLSVAYVAQYVAECLTTARMSSGVSSILPNLQGFS